MHQIANWLRDEFPTPHPVKLRFEQLSRKGTVGDCGRCSRQGRLLLIQVESRLRWPEAIDTLLHEWAHAVSWSHASLEHTRPAHSDEWALAYGRIYRRWVDELGWKESREYGW